MSTPATRVLTQALFTQLAQAASTAKDLALTKATAVAEAPAGRRTTRTLRTVEVTDIGETSSEQSGCIKGGNIRFSLVCTS